MRAVFIALLLAGCASPPQWYPVVDHNFLKSVTVTRGACDLGERACTTLKADGACHITMGSTADMCSLMHELAHCAGWNHAGPDAGCGAQVYGSAR